MTGRHRLGRRSVSRFVATALTAALVCELGAAQTTVIGQFTGAALTWDDNLPDPCLGSTKTDEVPSAICISGTIIAP